MDFWFWLVVYVYLWFAWRHFRGEYKFMKERRRMYERLEGIDES